MIKNELLLLYAVADMLHQHFISNDILEFKDNKLILKAKKAELKKANRMLLDDLFRINIMLSKCLNENTLKAIQTKYENILKSALNKKEIKELGFIPVAIALGLLANYTELKEKRLFNIHKNRVYKIIDLLTKEAKILQENGKEEQYKNLKAEVLYSYKVADILFNVITK